MSVTNWQAVWTCTGSRNPWFSLCEETKDFCFLEQHPQSPLNGIFDIGYSFIPNASDKNKTRAVMSVQVNDYLISILFHFSIQPIKVLIFSRSSSFMVLSFSRSSWYGVSVSSIGAKNSFTVSETTLSYLPFTAPFKWIFYIYGTHSLDF